METLEIAEALEVAGVKHKEAYSIAETIKDKSVSANDISELKHENIEIKDRFTKVEIGIAEVKTSLNWMKAIGTAIIALLIKLAFFP